MKRTGRFTSAALGAAIALTVLSSTASAQCLTTGTDVVGNPVFGATVNTFIGLGYNNLGSGAGQLCIENSVWSNPANFGLGTYVKGADGVGYGTDNTTLGAYALGGDYATAANSLDHAWVQDVGNQTTFGTGIGGRASYGIIWDLGGFANQLAVFVFVDHGPVPGEVLENTAWLSNDPNAVDGGWTQAILTKVYGGGWSADPNVSDGFVAVYQLPNAATFRYASVTWGGPGAVTQDGDNEIDAVGGLNFEGSGVSTTVPEPMTLALVGFGIVGIGVVRRRRS